MGTFFIKSGDFEIRIEDKLFAMVGSDRNIELQPHIAKLIDDLTDKFSGYDKHKTKKLFKQK